MGPLKGKYLVLCVSTEPEELSLKLPFYCHIDPRRFPRLRSKERVDYLAEAWNICHKKGLTRFPETTHIINLGSYYLRQIRSIRYLVTRYEEIDGDVILAGNVWEKKGILLPSYKTYDIWAYPDLEGLRWRLRKPRGLLQLNSVAMPCIYPVSAWRKHPFHNPDNMDDGIWYNQFCRESGLPVLCDLSIRFYRTKRDITGYSSLKQLHIIFGVRKRVRRLRRAIAAGH